MATLLEQRYRVDAPLARGGMSAVYRGLDTRLDRPVAIKVMDQRFAEDRSFVDRFEREARAAASLHHPNVVAVHDQGFDGDHVFLVMELVDGGTLRDLLTERGRLTAPLALSVLEPVLSALSAAHQAGLVHRDVKPENVLIGQQGTVKVGDFGLVRAMASAGTTSSSVILGTVAYLSPEQVTTGATTSRGDVYSAGVLLYEMLTGTPPYTGDTALSVAYRHVNDNVPPPSLLAPGIPPALDELVLRATRRDPAARPPDAGAFLMELERVRAATGCPVVPIPMPAHGQKTMPGLLDYPTLRTPSVEANLVVPGPRGTKAMFRSELDGVARPLIQRDPPPLAPPTGPPPIPQQPNPKSKRRRRMPLWALVAVLIAGLAGIGAWVMSGPESVPVPNVVGTTNASAIQTIQQAGLQPTVQLVRSNSVARDKVISTQPASGQVKKGAAVTVIVSAGPPVVPDIAPGSTEDTAKQEVQKQGLKPIRDPDQDEFDNNVTKGTVLRLSPSSGTQLKTGDTVAVVLSKGPQPLKPLPDVRGLSEEQARSALREAGYSIDTVTAFDRNIDGGKVISTSPAAGNIATSGKVSLVVSNSVTVPDLRGRRLQEAADELDKLGLNLQVAFGDNNGNRRIFQQGPGPGTLVQKGSPVQVATGFF
jgi:serine/threonine-protein kinase